MRLVDGEQRELCAAPSRSRQRGVRQPLGRDVEQVEIAGDKPPLDRGGLVRTSASSSAPRR